jgi:hypothetical protein
VIPSNWYTCLNQCYLVLIQIFDNLSMSFKKKSYNYFLREFSHAEGWMHTSARKFSHNLQRPRLGPQTVQCAVILRLVYSYITGLGWEACRMYWKSWKQKVHSLYCCILLCDMVESSPSYLPPYSLPDTEILESREYHKMNLDFIASSSYISAISKSYLWS